jgi:N-acyl homoserine lactone hydrolase
MMKTFLLIVLLLIVAGITALGLSFRAQTLPVSGDYTIAPPSASPPPEMRVSVLPSGSMRSAAAMAYRGGGFDDTRVFGMDVVLIEHPQGDLLIDAGFGRDVAAHFETTPMLMQLTASYEEEMPVVDRLAAAGRGLDSIKGVLLTHAHWDHVSGLADMPGVPVWLTPAERRFMRSGHHAVALAASLEGVNWHVYDFEHGPYLGFERSLDMYGDGSVVLVPSGGHTPGSVIVFVTLPEGRRYAFIGDLAWQSEGVSLPAERPWISRTLVDVDQGRVREVVTHLHHLQQAIPDLLILPSHDRRAFGELPVFAVR